MSSPNSLLLPLNGPEWPIRIVLAALCASAAGADAVSKAAAPSSTIAGMRADARVARTTSAVRASVIRVALDAGKCLIFMVLPPWLAVLQQEPQQHPCRARGYSKSSGLERVRSGYFRN